MKRNADRYISSGENLWSYADRVFCHCPKCDRQASISQSRICCLSCTYQEQKSEGKLHGDVLGTARSWNPHCSTCGYGLDVRLKVKASNSKLPQTKSVTCSICKQQTDIDLQWSIDLYSNTAIDPGFGCKLWLQIPCCGSILWVYNDRHLSDLKSYIGSSLRDGQNRRKWSMITRLPRWMIIAKNRDAVLKCIGKLEDRIASIAN